MAVKYLDVSGITEASKQFRDKITVFDECVTKMERETNNITRDWIGDGSNQFQTQMSLMTSQLEDISEVLYEIYESLLDAETAYIDQDVEVSKQFSINSQQTGGEAKE